MSHLKKTCGNRRSRGLSAAGFCAPFLLAIACWLVPLGSHAQGLGNDPAQLLQQLGRGGLGGGAGGQNGMTDTTTSQPQSQTLQPQSPLTNMRLPPSRLEQILSARAGIRLQQFGYDQLGSGRQVTVPETGAVQDDYIMGPGDQVVVSLRGQENSDFRTTVDRNGRVVLPRLAPIAASGRSFGSFREDVDALVKRAYVASSASVSIGQVRQISVLVSGEVNVPGQRLVTGLSSVVDAILLSGGIKKSGSLRTIRIQRGGNSYVVDLYSVLTGSGSSGAMRLADGDRVVVPTLGSTVAVAGLVRRPGIYELPARAGSMTARALLNLAGGEEVRGRYRLAVQRIESDGRLNLVALQGGSGLVHDSEILRVELGAELAGTQATLSGGVRLAGQYAVTTGTRLSDVIRAPGALGLSPYTPFGIMVRKDPRTLLRSLVAFTPVAVLRGGEDMPLQTDDVIRPITVDEAQLLTFILKTYLDKMALDQARIRNPLDTNRIDTAATQPATGGASSATDAANAAIAARANASAISPDNPFGLQPGQLDSYALGQEEFSGVPPDLQRSNIITLLNVPAPGTVLAQQRRLAYQQALLTANGSAAGQSTPQAQQAAMASAESGTPLQAPTLPGYPGQPYGQQQPGVGVAGGAVAGFNSTNSTSTNDQDNPNGQANSQPSQNFQDQPAVPGGYASNREVRTFGELSRQLSVDPLVLVKFLIDHRARLDGAVRGPGAYFVGPNVSLDDLVQAAGGTVSWADQSGVELLSTVVANDTGRAATQRRTLPLHQGTLASYVVRPHDQLHFNQVFTDTGIGSVVVQGEVRFAGNYPIIRGEHLSDLLVRVGGLTSTAYPAGTVFLRKSAAQIEQEGYSRAANEIQSQLLAGMARPDSGKIPGDATGAVQAFIGQLRNQKALGRVAALTADPSVLAANPQLDPLLEAGDVVFIPQRPSTVAVLGEVVQPGSYSYQPGLTVADYVKRAGGATQFSDDDLTFVVQPDGSARRLKKSWLGYDASKLPPGSAIVVPRDLSPIYIRQLLLDVTGILSSFAVTAAALAVLGRQ